MKEKLLGLLVLVSLLGALPQDDFIVNDDTLFGRPQGHPGIAKNNSGFTVVVFEDDRNWYESGRDIYGSIYDSTGALILSNFRINEESPLRDQYSPDVAVTDGGKFLVVFVDEGGGDPDISGKLYGADGTPLTSLMRINDDTGGACQSEPEVILKDGEFFVFFVDERYGEKDIFFGKLDTLGSIVGGNERVAFPAGFNEFSPRAVPLSSGEIALTFVADYEYSSHGYDVYLAILDEHGSLLRGPVRVNDDNTSRRQLNPAVVELDSSKILVVFEDERNGDADIYAAVFDTLLTPIGDNFQINDDITTRNQITPDLARSDENVLVVFGDFRNGGENIYGQFLNLDGSPYGNNFLVNDEEEGVREDPAVAFGDSIFTVVFSDTRNGEPDIYRKEIEQSGSFIGGDSIIVFEPTEGSAYWQTSPDIAVSQYGNFGIAFYDDRNMSQTLAPSIYFQCYTPVGTPMGRNRRVEDDSTGAWRRNPRIASGSMGKFLVVFEDERDGVTYIYGQLFNLDGTPIGDNFRIGDDTGYPQSKPSVAHTEAGYYLVVFEDARGGDADIYGQYVDEDGNLIGTNFPIETGVPGNYQTDPDVAMDSTGRALVVFVDDRNAPLYHADIYGVYLDPAGAPLSPPFRINDDDAYAAQQSPSVAMNSWGAAVVVFTDYRSSVITSADIYGQYFDPSGNPVGANFRVNDDSEYVIQKEPDVAIDEDGAFIVVFEDERGENPPDIYAQIFAYGGVPSDTNFVISEDTPREISQMKPRVGLGGGNMVVTWYAFPSPDAQNYNPDVYADLHVWSPPTQVAYRKFRPLLNFELYPNPLRKTGSIQFSLRERERVVLTFYDVSGRKVMRKDLGYLGPGVFHLPLDAGFFRSGVYFLEIRGESFRERRTFTVVR